MTNCGANINALNNIKVVYMNIEKNHEVIMGTYSVTTNPVKQSVLFHQKQQNLNKSIKRDLNVDFSNIDVMKKSGLIDNCRTVPTEPVKVSFRESFVNILTHLLEILHLYRYEVNSKFIPYFHVTPESQDSNNKIWIAVTGLDSYVKIEQLGSDSFKETQLYREYHKKKNGKTESIKHEEVRVFLGPHAQEFLQLLSQHDQQEREQLSELTVAANTLKLEVAKNNYDMKYSFDRQIERRMIELLREQKDLIPEKYLHQSSIKNLKLREEEFSSLLADVERQVLEGSSFVLCCGEKINGTISELLRKKITDSSHSTKSLTLSESPSYDFYEEIFNKAVFTPDECHLVRDSLVQDGIKPEKIAKIISCLSSRTGIGNLFYACSQAFHVANDNAALDVRRAATSVGDTIDVCPSFVALNGRNYHQHVDFSEYGFTQTLCVLGAVVNNANDTFDVANYIYTTKGENIIHNDAENDVRNLRRNISGNITIATYK